MGGVSRGCGVLVGGKIVQNCICWVLHGKRGIIVYEI